MDLDQYDEFGNYVGPELEASDDSDDEEAAIEAAAAADAAAAAAAVAAGGVSAADGELVRRGLVRMDEEDLQQQQQKPVPHELKQYYPTASEVYPEAETLVQEEDLQPITEPIIATTKLSDFDLLESELPETTFSFDYLAGLMHSPQCVRNICLLGHLHSGKTTFVDMLVEETHPNRLPPGLSLLTQHVEAPHANKRHKTYFRRYTDTRTDEQKRGLSIKATPISLVLRTSHHHRSRTLAPLLLAGNKAPEAADANGKDGEEEESSNGARSSSATDGSSHSRADGTGEEASTPFTGSRSFLFNIIDTPGHVCFSDEASAAMRLCDGAIYFVDALEGLQASAAPQLAQVVEEGLGLVVVFNKLDRLVLELRLRPQDAYYKIKCMLDELNETLETICSMRGLPPLVVSPRNRNLVFAMSQFSFVFSVESFAALYFDSYVFNPTATQAEGSSSSDANVTPKAAALFGGVSMEKLLKAEALQQQLQQQSQQGEARISRRKKHKETDEVANEGDHTKDDTPADVYTQLELFEIALWGDFYRDPETHRVVSAPPFPDAPRMFVEFILEPLYKLLAHCVAEERPTLEPTLAEEGAVASAMKAVDRKSPYLMIYTTKNYHRPNNYSAFDLLGRVMSGTVCKGHRVR
ncbi:116 kDa U5 small nuclear ribonucleoprotein component, partial [Cyclospora cayetanensis]|uniref:116 kDa U5 small nuclear ribonucleoprotein component n=1 Tax=Cyclospora cayetanensis TaxID=88456 RepID=A0A6P6S3C8_9EIME